MVTTSNKLSPQTQGSVWPCLLQLAELSSELPSLSGGFSYNVSAKVDYSVHNDFKPQYWQWLKTQTGQNPKKSDKCSDIRPKNAQNSVQHHSCTSYTVKHLVCIVTSAHAVS